MEDTLRENVIESLIKAGAVLILVLMEDTLKKVVSPVERSITQSLNPSFKGR